jgi:3-oxoacyl-[acyl-carrier protein] reductase
MAVDGKVAFITGAGRGIGKALALGFASEGYKVVVTSTTQERNAAVADQIRESGGEALPLEIDVSEEASVKAATSEALQKFGRLDVLVNNAGLKPGFTPPEQRLLKDLQLDTWLMSLRVNTTGPFLCSRELIPAMIAGGGGAIINVSSGAGLNARAGGGVYSVSKAALNMFTGVLAAELKDHGISVNGLLPGFTAVEGTRLDPSRSGPTPLKPETCLPVCLFLAAQDPIELTGEQINVIKWNDANGFGGEEVWSALS